ncbi:MAG: carbohydrate binding family 9 domain-containing protein [Acidobacteriia bacterium]|nr:carbohydrate binding family 9 domain-containing protein [Terriglobia bacterium]
MSASNAVGESATPTPTLAIPHVSRAPKLEDFLSGRPREAETVVTDFRQFDPGDGDPVSQPTTAYLSYDDKNLYVIFICRDDPTKIRARRARRDDLLYDDRITVNIDTFHDHRRSYWFDANLYGIQMDGITTDGVDDFSFDTLWYSEGRLLPDGYIVYEAIPFRSLRFPNTEKQTWGLALGRVIGRNNEFSWWPYMTRRLLPSWTGQLGHVEGIKKVSPGRNLQFIPYGMFSTSRFLDVPATGIPGIHTGNDARVGLDAKAVLKDAFTVDVALNPDFSQVESDEPQVTVNQRYAVYFPEKRPLFIENAAFFNTPEQLFFSRRIIDPQFGVRMTGKHGRWAVGALATDDRAPGRMVSASTPDSGRRAADGVVRVMREFASESYVGIFASSSDFAGSYSRVYALDTQLKLPRNWYLATQAIGSNTRQLDGQRFAGPAYVAALTHMDRKVTSQTRYIDRSPGFRTDLGFIQRVDIRQVQQTFTYRWRPEGRRVVGYGPQVSAMMDWNHAGQLLDWQVAPEFVFELTRMTTFGAKHSQSYELYQNLEFRKQQTNGYFNSQWTKWFAVNSSFTQGTGINYYPAAGVKPFLAADSEGVLGLTLRPTPQIKWDHREGRRSPSPVCRWCSRIISCARR